MVMCIMSYHCLTTRRQKMIEKGVKITFRARVTLRNLVRKYVGLDLHMNESEFYRHAAIEKIKNDAPELYHEFYKELCSDIPEEAPMNDDD